MEIGTMGLILYEDTRNKHNKHKLKNEWWVSHGVEVERKALDFGDYMTDGSNISVDTKRSVAELAQNVRRDHARFKREIERANAAGCKLVVLVEEKPRDLVKWTNPHCRSCEIRRRSACAPMSPRGRCARHGTVKPIQGPSLSKTLRTMEERYGVVFEFCKPGESARRVCEILGIDYAE